MCNKYYFVELLICMHLFRFYMCVCVCVWIAAYNLYCGLLLKKFESH